MLKPFDFMSFEKCFLSGYRTQNWLSKFGIGLEEFQENIMVNSLKQTFGPSSFRRKLRSNWRKINIFRGSSVLEQLLLRLVKQQLLQNISTF